MRLKQTLTKFAVIGGLAMANRGLLPAPMCPNCRTPGDFTTYITTVGRTQPVQSPTVSLLLLYLSMV
jgi:hypothetical protein